MTAAQNEPSESTTRQFRPNPRVGEKHRPYNRGNLGYTYTIYRFYGSDGTLLYIGETARVRKRIVDHQLGNPRGLPLGHDDGPKPWWREAGRIELEHLPPGTTEREAMAIEREQIERLHPVYNRDFNEEFFDRVRRDTAIDYAHFEVDLATAEHERHDGVVRALNQIEAEAVAASDRVGFGPFSYTPRTEDEVAAQRITFSDPYRSTDQTMVQPEVASASTITAPMNETAVAPIDPILAPIQSPKAESDFSSDGRGSTIALALLVGLLIAALLAAAIVAISML